MFVIIFFKIMYNKAILLLYYYSGYLKNLMQWYCLLSVGSANDKTDMKYNVPNEEFHVFMQLVVCLYLDWQASSS